MVDAASIKVRFPEFSIIPDARIELFLADASIILNETFWGEKYDMGLSYLTAHYLTLGIKTGTASAKGSGNIAPISSKGVDGVSISYAIAVPDNALDGYYQ